MTNDQAIKTNVQAIKALSDDELKNVAGGHVPWPGLQPLRPGVVYSYSKVFSVANTRFEQIAKGFF